MEMGESHQTPQLGDYFGPIRRQWWIVLMALLVGVAVAFGLLYTLPPSYQSSASVLVKSTSATSQSTSARTVGTVNLDTEAQVAKSLPVASAVKTQLHSPLTAGQLASRVSVSVPPNTTIMKLTYTSGTASDAQKGAEAFAAAYLDYRSAQAESQAASELKVLDNLSRSTAADIQAQTRSVTRARAGSVAQKNAQQSLKALQKRLAAINSRRLPVETAQTSAGSIIDSAPLPTAPSSPNRVLVIASSIVVLLFLGLALAWWRDRHLGRVRRLGEVEGIPSVEVLGAVGTSDLVHTNQRGRRRRRASFQQQYRQIVHALEARLTDAESTVLVTGVGRGTAAQNVAVNLAAAVARTGWDVTLVHVDQPTAAKSGERVGATLAAAPSLPASISVTSLEQADLVVDGDIQTAAVGDFLTAVEASSGLVLVSTSPTGASADAQAIAPFAQLSVLVVELDRTTHGDLSDALRQLRSVGSRTTSIVVVSPRAKSRRPARPYDELEAWAPGSVHSQRTPALRETSARRVPDSAEDLHGRRMGRRKESVPPGPRNSDDSGVGQP